MVRQYLMKQHPNPWGIHSDVRGILLEFIDGLSLEELKYNSPLALANPHLGESTVKLFEKIVALGVLHGDVRLANVMVTRNGQLFLIDFGLAVVHQDESEDVWNERVISEAEVSSIKLLLHQQQLRDRTPPEPYPNFRASYETFNRVIEYEREDWRRKYYDRVFDCGRSEVRVDEKGKKYLHQPPQWRLKRDAVEARQKYLDQYRIIYVTEDMCFMTK